jgi:L-aspartate oxidase
MRIVVVGAGLAGLFTALECAPLPVTVLSAAPLGEGASSAWAQGGIAAALGEGDAPALHARDTIAAGAGIVDLDMARIVTGDAPNRIGDLVTLGVPFDRDTAGGLVQSREAAHSAARVVRVTGDRAGHAIMQAVIAAVAQRPSVRVLEGTVAVDLEAANGRVGAVVVEQVGADGRRMRARVAADAVVMATGGIGGLYAVTTNPVHCRGEGIAMAARAGAAIADAELVQFHPTGIDIGRDPAPLATEALRGEGAWLVDRDGRRFMVDEHPAGELAPRDIVARAVHRSIAAGKGAFLDCRSAIGDRFPQAFPTVFASCSEAGIDPRRAPIPVAPAAHYHMGGIATDADGKTHIGGLWAVGECASTGLHGANRLASNSLLEGVVMGRRVAMSIRAAARAKGGRRASHAPLAALGPAPSVSSEARIAAIRGLREIMSRHLGVERDGAGLREALRFVERLRADAGDDMALANAALAAHFVVEGALRRKESRGAHFRRDYPEPDPHYQRRLQTTLAGLGLRASALAGAFGGADPPAKGRVSDGADSGGPEESET